jgi:hypothetical protein
LTSWLLRAVDQAGIVETKLVAAAAAAAVIELVS